MSIRTNKHPVLNLIKPQHVLVSVFDKTGLDILVAGILEINPNAKFYSTGGTGKRIMEILGDKAATNYISVEQFTGALEMEGGLVKTLHPKIHAGLLAERNNPAHEEYLIGMLTEFSKYSGVYFDIFVGNLYPFTSVIAKEDCTPEDARVNIDIGGPAMTMAAAKNWHSVAALTDPLQYPGFLQYLRKEGGTTLHMRFNLAVAAMMRVGEYRKSIGDYFSRLDFEKDVLPTLNIAGGE